VRELDSVADELQSLAGTITQDHAAHGVLLDGGGSSQLLWH
jgi:exopolysaccharide biosynthesis protein